VTALGIAALAMAAAGGCSNGDDASSDVVGSADAITAAVAWQADEQEPVLDDDGEAQLPVIFVVADDGATIDVGVQADVAASTVDWATVRFADDVADTFAPDLDGEPVRDDGVLLLLGPMAEPARSVEIDLVRYTAADSGEAFTLEITAETGTDDTGDTGDGAAMPRAVVTAVTQP
jgi:hypothetical protein